MLQLLFILQLCRTVQVALQVDSPTYVYIMYCYDLATRKEGALGPMHESGSGRHGMVKRAGTGRRRPKAGRPAGPAIQIELL